MQTEPVHPWVPEVVFSRPNGMPFLVPNPESTGGSLAIYVGTLRLAITYYVESYLKTNSIIATKSLTDSLIQWVLAQEIETYRLIPIDNHNPHDLQSNDFYHYLKKSLADRLLLDYIDTRIPKVGNDLSTKAQLVGNILYLNFLPK